MDEDSNDRRIRFEWFNHLTTLSLIILGGILGFVPRDPIPVYAMVAITFVAFGGAAAVGQSQRIVERAEPQTRWRRFFSNERFASLAISVGAGVFLGGLLLDGLLLE